VEVEKKKEEGREGPMWLEGGLFYRKRNVSEVVLYKR